MRWRKIGKIFDPSRHPAFDDYAGYAQSPQALVLSDRVRVYFSIRKRDAHGKFLSHVAFVDFDRQMNGIIDWSREPVIALGELGAFDEHGIFPLNPLKVGDMIWAFTCGWSRRVSVSVETSIGLAISSNQGVTFDKIGEGPIMTSALLEPFLVGDAFVKIIDGKFHMWYIFGNRWVQFPGEPSADRIYKIAHAVSIDGIEWNRDGIAIIGDRLHDECQALPTVLEFDGKFHMLFCYRYPSGFRSVKGRGYRLGYAWSRDLHSWTRSDEILGIALTDGSWDSDMMCYPHLFSCDDNVYLLYNGNEFGKFGFGLAVLEEP